MSEESPGQGDFMNKGESIDTSPEPTGEGGLSLLEQVRVASAKRCANPASPRLIGFDHDKNQAFAVKAYCNMWYCETCAARKARYWIAKVINGINRLGGEWFFLTVTANQNQRGSKKSAANIRDGWSKLYDRMRRQNGGKFHYVKVWEPHTDGSWHLHLITDCVLPYSENNKKGSKWLSDNSAACGMGYMTDYQPCAHAGFAAHYVAKYLIKSPTMDNAPDYLKNMHRIRTSNNFPKLPNLSEDSEHEFIFVGTRDIDALGQLVLEWGRGWHIYRQGGSRLKGCQIVAWLVSNDVTIEYARWLYEHALWLRKIHDIPDED